MITLTARTTSEMWLTLTQAALRDGDKVFDDSEELRELLYVAFTVTDPLAGDERDKWMDQDMVSAMHANFHSLEPQFGYKVSYGERLWTPEGASPYDHVRALLTRKPAAKSATISLLRTGDADLGHVPCITSIDFKIRDGLLHVCYFARSQDLFKKNFADNLAIYAIGQKLAADLSVQPGSVSAFIASGHVYASDVARMRAVEPIAQDALTTFGEAS